MNRRGATIMNYIMIIGLLVVGAIVISNIQLIFGMQAKAAEQDFASSFADDLVFAIERAIEYRSDAEYVITLAHAEEYQLNVTQGMLSIYLPRKDVSVRRTFMAPALFVVPSHIENLGQLTVYNRDGYLYVTDKIELCTFRTHSYDGSCNADCLMFREPDWDCYINTTGKQPDGICSKFVLDGNGNRNGVTDAGDGTDGFCDTDCVPYNGLCDYDCPQQGYIDQDC